MWEIIWSRLVEVRIPATVDGTMWDPELSRKKKVS